MLFISEGITKVRAIKLASGIRPDGRIVTPAFVLVKWRSSLEGRLYQVYVNGRYGGTTVDSNQRQMVVPIPASEKTAVRIEVFAVEAMEGHIDFADESGLSKVSNGRVKIILLRGQNLPLNSAVVIYSNNGAGEINYDKPVTEKPIRIWPGWQDKGGFGMSRFGVSDFGFDWSAGIGFGKGCFGLGQFGPGVDTFEWTSKPLDAGVYKFGIKVIDEAGNESEASESGDITVTPAAMPAEGLDISSFDKQTNQLVLSVL